MLNYKHMKQYIEKDNFLYDENNGACILKDPSNIYYQDIIKNVEQGEAVLIPSPAPSITWEGIRVIRNSLLKDSDWAALPDAALKFKQEWLAYRQALRDITITFNTPESVAWPNKPE